MRAWRLDLRCAETVSARRNTTRISEANEEMACHGTMTSTPNTCSHATMRATGLLFRLRIVMNGARIWTLLLMENTRLSLIGRPKLTDPIACDFGIGKRSSPMQCPKCFSDHVDRDEIDIGVGTQCGPYRCFECGWEEGRGGPQLLDTNGEPLDADEPIGRFHLGEVTR